MDIKNNIEKIKQIDEVTGWFGSELSISNDELTNIINNISSIEEIKALPPVVAKYINKDLMEKLFSNKKLANNISSDFIRNIPQNVFLELSYNVLHNLTIQQAMAINNNILYYLSNNNNILYMNNDALFAAMNKVDFSTGYYDNAINAIFNKLSNSDYILKFRPEQIARINKTKLATMDVNVLHKMKLSQVTHLSKDTINYLVSQSRLQDFSDDVIKYFGDDLSFYYNGIIGNAINAINIFSSGLTYEQAQQQIKMLCHNDKIHLLSPKTLSTLDSYLLKEINEDNIKKFTAEQLNAIGDKIQYISPDIINNINIKIINELDDKIFKAINEEQAQYITLEQTINIIKNNKLHNFKNESLKIIINNNFNNNLLKNIQKDELVKTINSFDNNFFDFMSNDNLKIIDKNIFNELNIKQFSSITADQINFLFLNDNDFLKHLPSGFIKYLNYNEFCKLNDNIFKNINKEQIKDINNKQLDYLLKNNKLSLLKNETLQSIKEQISFSKLDNKNIVDYLNDFNKNDKLKELSAEALSTIPINKISNDLDNEMLLNISNLDIKTKTYKEVEDSSPILDNDLIIKYSKQQNNRHLEVKDFEFAIYDCLRDENYKKLQNNCIEWFKNRDYRKNVVSALYKRVNKCRNNIYGKIDKIELLKLLTLTESNEKKNVINYQLLEKTIKDLNDTTPETIDGHISKIKEFSNIIRECNFDMDFLEMMAQENIKNLDKCIDAYYSNIEKNSIDTGLKDLYANCLIDYANLIAQKYSIDLQKFETQLDEFDERTLTKEERIYFNAIKKAFEYKPDIESSVKSWVTPVLKTAIKSLGAYFGTKVAATASGSTIVTAGVAAAGVGVVAVDVAGQYDKKNYFLNPKSYHEKERNKRDSALTKTWKVAKNIAYYGTTYWWLTPAKAAVKAYKKYKGYDMVGFDNDNRKQSSELKSYLFKKNTIKDNFKKSKDVLFNRYQEDFNSMDKKLIALKSKEAQAIKDFIKLKAQAIDISTKRKIAKLYSEYPEFNDTGIFNKLLKVKDIALQTGKGIISSVFDIATLGYGSDFYNKFIESKSGEEKVKCESRLREFQKKISEIDKNTCDKLNRLTREEVQRLSALNKQDFNIVDYINVKENEDINKLEEQFNSFLTGNKFKNTLYDFYKLSNTDDSRLQIDTRIINKINKNTGILNGIEKLSIKSKNIINDLENAYSQVVSLAIIDNIDQNVISNNLNQLSEKIFYLINNGYLNFEEVKEILIPILAMSKHCENNLDKNISKMIKDNYENIKENIDSKFVDLIEKKEKEKTIGTMNINF